MLNNPNVVTVEGTTRKTILVDEMNSTAFSCKVVNTGVDADASGRKIVKAGTPIAGDLEDRGTAYTKAATTSGTKGTWTLQITTAFAADEKITIDGVDYTCKATESVEDKQFAGANANAQAASLKKMIESDKFDVTVSTDTLTFTQKVADSTGTGPVASKTATTGAIGDVTAGTPAVDGTNNATGILLHDVDVTDGTKNAQVVVFGFIDMNKLEADVQTLITNQVRQNLRMIQFVR